MREGNDVLFDEENVNHVRAPDEDEESEAAGVIWVGKDF